MSALALIGAIVVGLFLSYGIYKYFEGQTRKNENEKEDIKQGDKW